MALLITNPILYVSLSEPSGMNSQFIDNSAITAIFQLTLSLWTYIPVKRLCSIKYARSYLLRFAEVVSASQGGPLWYFHPYSYGVLFKGPNIIVCVLLVSNSRGCCLAPRRDNTRGSLTPTIHTHNHVWFRLQQDVTMFSTATNILSIKSNSKFESRATTVCIAMSPRYLGGKYRSRFHPRSRKCARQLLQGTERVKSHCARPASTAARGDNEVDHALYLKVEFQMHTVLSNENGEFYTTTIYPCFSRSVYVFSMGSPAWWRFGLCLSGNSLVSRWRARNSNVTSQM